MDRPDAAEATKYVKSPITGELIRVEDMAEHMRISLIDPRYQEQREAMMAKIRDTTKARCRPSPCPTQEGWGTMALTSAWVGWVGWRVGVCVCVFGGGVAFAGMHGGCVCGHAWDCT